MLKLWPLADEFGFKVEFVRGALQEAVREEEEGGGAETTTSYCDCHGAC